MLTRSKPVHLITGSTTLIDVDSYPTLKRLRELTCLWDTIDSSLANCLTGWCTKGQQDRSNEQSSITAFGESSPCGLTQDRVLLAHLEINLVQQYADATQIQKVDFQVTSMWFKSRIWSACVSHSLLCFDASTPELNLTYPLEIVAQLNALMLRIPSSAFAANGACMVSPRPLDSFRDFVRTADMLRTVYQAQSNCYDCKHCPVFACH